MASGRSFAASDRFISEVTEGKMRPAYVFVGDEIFFRDRCRAAILQHLIPAEMRELSVYEFDLAETSVMEVLDRAQTPSLMAPFQVFFVRNVKVLYGRGSHKEDFAAVEAYCKNPNPNALVIFVADHISIPADVRRMDMQDKDKYERLRETLGEWCTMLEFARVDEGDGVRWVIDTAQQQAYKIDADAARELVDSLGADMMLVSGELEKLMLYTLEKKRITLGDVETMVLAAKQRNLYELTDAISSSHPETGKKPPSATFTCWREPSSRCWSCWSAISETLARSGRRSGKASVFHLLRPTISSARLGGISRAAILPERCASSPGLISTSAPTLQVSVWCWKI
jgi:DNA polymerase-3 subunit delta